MTTNTVVDQLRQGLIVSCQASTPHPLRNARIIAALARCAELGGAAGVRVNSSEDVRATKDHISLPMIAIDKVPLRPGRFLITPDLGAARDLALAGADMIALEVTAERPGGVAKGVELIVKVHRELDLPVMADVSTLEEGLSAWRGGAELVATTLSGYTPYTIRHPGPDVELARAMAQAGIRTVLEGRISSPLEVAAAFAEDVWAVVVGRAITDPVATTARFAEAIPKSVRGG
jgi:N-acylglucosamine-6-phosphate 2-epimerase